MGRIGVCGIDTGAGPSFPEELGTDDSVSGLILSNNLLYNLYSFAWESVHLGNSSLSKMACIEQKVIFPYVWYIK